MFSVAGAIGLVHGLRFERCLSSSSRRPGKVANVALDHLFRGQLGKESHCVISITLAVGGANDSEVSVCIQPDHDVSDRLGSAKGADGDFLVTRTIA